MKSVPGSNWMPTRNQSKKGDLLSILAQSPIAAVPASMAIRGTHRVGLNAINLLGLPAKVSGKL